MTSANKSLPGITELKIPELRELNDLHTHLMSHTKWINNIAPRIIIRHIKWRRKQIIFHNEQLKCITTRHSNRGNQSCRSTCPLACEWTYIRAKVFQHEINGNVNCFVAQPKRRFGVIKTVIYCVRWAVLRSFVKWKLSLGSLRKSEEREVIQITWAKAFQPKRTSCPSSSFTSASVAPKHINQLWLMVLWKGHHYHLGIKVFKINLLSLIPSFSFEGDNHLRKTKVC